MAARRCAGRHDDGDSDVEGRVKVVVTGASGHLGDAITRALREEGYEVVAVGGPRTGGIDLRHDRAVDDLAVRLGSDVALVHAAGLHPPATAATTADDRRALIDVNVLGTQRVLDAARRVRGGVAAVVYVSSFEVYGAPIGQPIDEDHPTRPLFDYGATKLAGEDHALAFGEEEGARVTCLRMPAVYGPGERTPRLLPLCLSSVARGEAPTIHGDGHDLRDQLYVEDAAAAVVAAIGAPGGGIFNIADGAAHSVAEIALTAMEVAGLSGGPRRAPRLKPRRDYHMSIARARAALGFKPRIPLREGMARQLAWLRAAR
jgi:nucleoside-diphosphate-sugar epimerase